MAVAALHMACKLITSTPLNYQNLAPSSRLILPTLFNHHSNSVKSLQSITTSRKSRGRFSTVYNAVKAEESLQNRATPAASSKLVLVIGASGGVGQLVVASLLNRNIKSRLLVRDPEKAATLFGEQDEDKLQVFKGDIRNPEDLDPSMFEGVTHVICCTGTTAFPSKRWDGDNTPERVDCDGARNLISALPPSLKRVVLVSSVGVTKFNELPWSIMNLCGVLKYKKMGEDCLIKSGLPYTIIRPGRLTDGPYTSYDLNTLLKATAGERRAVIIGQVAHEKLHGDYGYVIRLPEDKLNRGDKLVGEVSRLVVAEACLQALDIECTQGQIYEINSIKGEGPENNKDKWEELFRAATAHS